MEPQVRFISYWGCFVIHVNLAFRLCSPLLLAVGISGCGFSESSRPNLSQSLFTPEEDLEWAIQRLRSALDVSSSSGGSGLHVKRKMNYKYNAPGANNSAPTALVTIESLSIFLTKKSPPPEPKDAADKENDQNLFTPIPGLDDPFGEEDEDYQDLLLNQQHKGTKRKKRPIAADANVPAPRKHETQEFRLVYREGKWQLEEEPEGEYEQALFKYALQ